ncbi:hypothetical protein [Shewanella xiamenensis]|uniref:hypothetical protein n=1 Tax=Shewanella xiamenensis TaxID=332186 RepID=UPI0021C1FF9A|nr:hypothetical protein [Shewanella xiamenensis]MCT8869356.1 hypothetical protein [Shewanella xiamenensis]
MSKEHEVKVSDIEECVFSELLKPPKLPSSSDVLFTSQEDWWNNACVNWCHDRWGIYANGYKEAADILVNQVEIRAVGAYQDSLVYPVIFIYRQYLELAIKGLLQDAKRLQDIKGDMPKHHRIDQIWIECRNLLSEIWQGNSIKKLDQITRLLKDFAKVDPTSEAFRYPHDKKGQPSLEGLTHINLRNVREVIGKISVILTGAQAQINEYLGYKADMEHDTGWY